MFLNIEFAAEIGFGYIPETEKKYIIIRAAEEACEQRKKKIVRQEEYEAN